MLIELLSLAFAGGLLFVVPLFTTLSLKFRSSTPFILAIWSATTHDDGDGTERTADNFIFYIGKGNNNKNPHARTEAAAKLHGSPVSSR